MRGKVASALVYLSSDEFKGEDIFQHLTRQDIADFTSVTIESAKKFLKEFEREDIITLDGRHIEIIDKATLMQISKHS